MIKKVAFFCKHFGERGTEKTTFDYAEFNEKILGNKSYIICFSEKVIKKNNYIKSKEFIKKKYLNRFEVCEINNIFEIREILEKNEIAYFYVQSHGFHRDIFQFDNYQIWKNCRTIYHCAFGPMVRQGSDVRCIVGSYLNKRFLKNLPVLPPIVRTYKKTFNLREKLNIPQNALVVGRHGGKDTFDIKFVKKVIRETIEVNKNIYFLFLNTEKFLTHDRVIHLNNFTDNEVSTFISTCDAMIHGRFHGETFGLAVAEFSAANKPVITFGKSKDKEHLRILNKKALIYNNEKELTELFKELPKISNLKRSWNAYKAYEPERVMKEFEKICLTYKKETLNNQIYTFLIDLPWEIKVLLEEIINFCKKPIFKLIPRKTKDKIKNSFKIPEFILKLRKFRK